MSVIPAHHMSVSIHAAAYVMVPGFCCHLPGKAVTA